MFALAIAELVHLYWHDAQLNRGTKSLVSGRLVPPYGSISVFNDGDRKCLPGPDPLLVNSILHCLNSTGTNASGVIYGSHARSREFTKLTLLLSLQGLFHTFATSSTQRS